MDAFLQLNSSAPLFQKLELALGGSELGKNLKAAHMTITVRMYLRSVILNMLGSCAIFCTIFAFMALTETPVPFFSFLPQIIFWVLLFVLMVPGLFIFQLYYPAILARGRQIRIDLDLPYAISYMQALSTTMSPYEVIRKVYEDMDMFGEVSKEFGMILRDIDLFGDDLITAMHTLQQTTPSHYFRDFLNDLGIVFESGGDVTAYLAARSEFFRDRARQEQELTLKTIEIMAEVYVAAFVAGPIAMIIMIIAQGMTGKSQMEWLMPFIYICIPLGAIVMIWLLSVMLPPENLEITRKESVEYTFGSSVPIARMSTAPDPKFYKRIEEQKKRFRYQNKLRQPLKSFISDYLYAVIAGGMLGVIVAVMQIAGILGQFFPRNGYEVFICLLLIALMVPVMIAYESRRWYVRNVEAHIPEFLRELSDMKDIGITMQEAIHRISSAKLGLLSSELQVVSTDIRTGAYVTSALVRMEERIGLVSVKRAISLLVRASEVTDYLRQIFMIAISDFEYYLKLKRDRANTTIVYVMIIYLSFGIFLYTAYQLNVPFISSFKAHNVAIDLSGNITDMFRIGILLGGFSGIMAGQFSSNSILCGFKHSIVFLAASVMTFVYII